MRAYAWKTILGSDGVLNTLFDVGEVRLIPGLPREIAQVMTGWEPIPGLLD